MQGFLCIKPKENIRFVGMDNQVYLGVAIKYPIALGNGRVLTLGGYALIEQSIADILCTPKGSRMFNRGYGSRLDELKFEPNDLAMEGALLMLIEDAITTWETRTQFMGCEFEFDDSAVLCTIFHRPLPSNEIQSFIYPFYRTLAT